MPSSPVQSISIKQAAQTFSRCAASSNMCRLWLNHGACLCGLNPAASGNLPMEFRQVTWYQTSFSASWSPVTGVNREWIRLELHCDYFGSTVGSTVTRTIHWSCNRNLLGPSQFTSVILPLSDYYYWIWLGWKPLQSIQRFKPYYAPSISNTNTYDTWNISTTVMTDIPIKLNLGASIPALGLGKLIIFL